jgi:hypothetical protein
VIPAWQPNRRANWSCELLVFDPSIYVGEILGQTAAKSANPSSAAYLCPFINSTCTKRGHAEKTIPYPVCSVRHKTLAICTCPKRFTQADIVRDAVNHCWLGKEPDIPQIAAEVQMKGFGKIDFVIAEVDATHFVHQFLSVELQAVDITGSVRPAYDALLAGTDLSKSFRYGINWDNVHKRYVTQLVRKGFFHYHWGTRLVSVLQAPLYDYICAHSPFGRTRIFPNPSDTLAKNDPHLNVIFMVYDYEPNHLVPAHLSMALKLVEGARHGDIQTAAAMLYNKPPSRDDFCKVILRRLGVVGAKKKKI